MNQIFLETRMFMQALGWRRNHDASFLRFDTIPECDKQTDRRTDRQTDIPPLAIPALCIARYANALVKIRLVIVSATCRPIHSAFGSKVGFSESADRMALLPVGTNSIGM